MKNVPLKITFKRTFTTNHLMKGFSKKEGKNVFWIYKMVPLKKD